MINKKNREINEQLQLNLLIEDIRKNHPSMGLRDLYFKIQPEFMGRDKFESYCKQAGYQIDFKDKRIKTTYSSGVIRFDNHIKNLKITRINQVWQSDITYYEVGDRFYYLTFIIDAFSRRILGYSVSMRLLTENTTLPAIKMALKTRNMKKIIGLILHSDGGGQYYDKEFLTLTSKTGIINSMCKYAYENGKAERINGIIKNNYLKYKGINSFEKLIKEVDHAVQMYNYEKPHIKLKRKTPIQFEKNLILLSKQESATMTKSFEAKTPTVLISEGIEPSENQSKKVALKTNVNEAKTVFGSTKTVNHI